MSERERYIDRVIYRMEREKGKLNCQFMDVAKCLMTGLYIHLVSLCVCGSERKRERDRERNRK